MANWLNHFVDTAGVWTRGQDRAIAFSTEQTVGGRDIEILEVAVSGGAALSGDGAAIAPVGGPEVFLTIRYANGNWEYRSAPSETPYTLSDVQSFTISTLVCVGNDACNQVHYAVATNAHCQWQ